MILQRQREEWIDEIHEVDIEWTVLVERAPNLSDLGRSWHDWTSGILEGNRNEIM